MCRCLHHVPVMVLFLSFFFFNDTATTEIYTHSLHDALPILVAFAGQHHQGQCGRGEYQLNDHLGGKDGLRARRRSAEGSEEHTSELQSLAYLVCRLLLEKKKKIKNDTRPSALSNSLESTPAT